ncbi:hypothetical protein BU598_06175 [Staphylococcus arlettae]|uniref:DNA damage-induced cell division inhibitor SosA n=1 Tax=Staphylococcus arlettae TaxID=29378 RepID=UPI000E6A43F7|nr:DNA damage-induced cell division inhibitor SosA [Staphylococcus arlettae]RIM61036.1 hypothetical protein BU598_06175 [Staphylococcus arlettae]
MNSIYMSQIKTYLLILVTTMLLCTIFVLTADINNNREQTYEMTDHKITTEHKEQNNNQLQQDLNSEQVSNQTMAVIK